MKRTMKAAAAALAALLLAAGPVQASPQAVTAVKEMQTLPGNWSPMSGQTPEKEFLLSLTASPLYRPAADGKTVEPVLAAALPADVTAEFAGDKRYGVPKNAARGYAFAIDLREDACWEDGSPITAEDLFFTAGTILASGSPGQLPLLANMGAFLLGEERQTGQILSLADVGYDSVRDAQNDGITEFYIDTSAYWGLTAGWQSAQSRMRLLDDAVMPGCSEMYVTPAYLFRNYLDTGTEYAYFQRDYVGIRVGETQPYTLADVGILVTGERQLTLILAGPSAPSALALELAALPVLPEAQYAADYGTAPDRYLSCGPWRIASADAHEIVLVPNEHWWGEAEDAPYTSVVCRRA